MAAPDLDALPGRLGHLVAVEGFGHGYGLAPALRRSWSSAPVPAIAVCRTTVRLRALDRDDRERVLAGTAPLAPEVRAIVESARGEPPWPEPLGPGFSEPLAGDDAEVNTRMAQWVRRIRFLIREEDLAGDKARALCFSDAAQRLFRRVAPGASGYLLDASITSETPSQRSAWLFLLGYRYATLIADGDSDEVVIRKIAGHLQSYRGESAGLAPEVAGRLIDRGLLPPGFSVPTPSPALRDRQGPA